MRVVCWNVNSILAREERVFHFIKRVEPDVLCLQELKVVDEKFPMQRFRDLGYHCEVWGEKTYNGVAVISRVPPEKTTRGFCDDGEKAARFLLADFKNFSVASVYVPNGQAVGSDKYAYKLAWLDRLQSFLTRTRDKNDKLLLAGDFNIAPEGRDVWDEQVFEGQLLFSEPEKEKFQALLEWGFHDTFRKFSKDRVFSWWDYRMLAFPKNRGARIDFLLATAPLYELCTRSSIEREERKGEKPSDHAPLIGEFRI